MHMPDFAAKRCIVLIKFLRKREGRNSQPSAACIDSQSVKTTSIGGIKGYDGGKKVNGRKRHILVDTLGFLLTVVVHAADIQDNLLSVDLLADHP